MGQEAAAGQSGAVQPDRSRERGPVRTIGRDGGIVLAFLASFASFFVNLATWDVLYFPVTRIIFWLMAGLAIAFVRILETERKSEVRTGCT